jgi:dihydrofolate synthase/folylpolyglutamate synthase
VTRSDEEHEGYRRALDALQARGRFGIRLGLSRTRALLRALGSPERTFRGALIAGTNGKGSVQALVASALRASNERVGQTPKPHLVSYRERIVVDGRPIAPADFAAVVGDVLRAAAPLEARHGPATEFELLTAAAMAWFARSQITVGVVEVGLGGRLDATNAWDGGVAVITNVDLDHTDRLGSTIRAIAREKAAIVKRGNLAVTGATGEALAVIRSRARRVSAPLVEVEPLPVVAMDRGGLRLHHRRIGEISLGLLGRHQAANAATAIATLDVLRDAATVHVDDETIRHGFAAARWPGRLELLALDGHGTARPAGDHPRPGSPDVLLDGAHNEAGMAALATAFDELRPELSAGRPTILLALMADKDVPAILRALAGSEALRRARIITAEVSRRSLPAAELAAAWRRASGGGEAIDAADVAAAFARAAEASRSADGPLVVAGSLYLVGAVRAMLLPDAIPGG